MSRKSTLAVVAAVLLVLALAIAASAQIGVPVQKPMKPKVQQQMQLQGLAGAMAEGWAGGRQHIGAFASLERILLPPNRRELEKMSMVLNPTEEQKARIRELYKALFAAVKSVQPQKQEAIKAVVAGLAQASPSKSDVEAWAAKVQQADQVIISAEIDFWIGLKSVLSPQQQQQVQMMFQQRVEHEINPGAGRQFGPVQQ